MQKGNSAEIAKRDARRMFDESARDAGKECAEILDENVRDVGQECRGMLNGTACGIVMPDSVPASVIIKNVLGNVKGTVRVKSDGNCAENCVTCSSLLRHSERQRREESSNILFALSS